MTTMCFTGHRPPGIDGYHDTMSPKEVGITGQLVELIKAMQGVDTYISGGALGVDQMAALAVIFVRDQVPGYENIRLTIARPFPSQASKWPAKSQEYLESLCSKANEVVDVSEDPYAPYKMEVRNHWMVDRSLYVAAVWNQQQTGGTYNCINYAMNTRQIPVLNLDPNKWEEGWRLMT
ncbi:MAG: hypothetical protein DRN30_03200 [Thermoplasmata archaeon]|nr:MAG: hypothetical protein DRN30_03200 [Thermoplasmata archaeon]